MTSTRLNPLAEDYLARLDAAAVELPQADREELVAEVRAHIETGLSEAASDADVRNLLDDLGSPAEIAAAAARESDMGAPVGAAEPLDHGVERPTSPWGTLEILAVLGLTLGAVAVPVVGPLIGLCFAWASPRWAVREKVIATALTLVPVITLALGAAVFMHSGPSSPVPAEPTSSHVLGGK